MRTCCRFKAALGYMKASATYNRACRHAHVYCARMAPHAAAQQGSGTSLNMHARFDECVAGAVTGEI